MNRVELIARFTRERFFYDLLESKCPKSGANPGMLFMVEGWCYWDFTLEKLTYCPKQGSTPIDRSMWIMVRKHRKDGKKEEEKLYKLKVTRIKIIPQRYHYQAQKKTL